MIKYLDFNNAWYWLFYILMLLVKLQLCFSSSVFVNLVSLIICFKSINERRLLVLVPLPEYEIETKVELSKFGEIAIVDSRDKQTRMLLEWWQLITGIKK